VIALKSAETGKYLTVSEDGSYTVDGDEVGEAQQFILYDWGQNNYSLQSVLNGQFLDTYTPEGQEAQGGWFRRGPSAGDQLGATSETTISLTGTDSDTSSLPTSFFVKEVSDGNVVLAKFNTSSLFGNSSYSGNLFVVEENALYVSEDSIDSTPTVEDDFDANAKFAEEIVTDTAADAAELAKQYDTAVLFVGQAA
jgi:hypothetical protein